MIQSASHIAEQRQCQSRNIKQCLTFQEQSYSNHEEEYPALGFFSILWVFELHGDQTYRLQRQSGQASLTEV